MDRATIVHNVQALSGSSVALGWRRGEKAGMLERCVPTTCRDLRNISTTIQTSQDSYFHHRRQFYAEVGGLGT